MKQSAIYESMQGTVWRPVAASSAMEIIEHVLFSCETIFKHCPNAKVIEADRIHGKCKSGVCDRVRFETDPIILSSGRLLLAF
jgi:hypothetical protein